jgi:nucleoside phosphorylase/CheY-like chemotaxis protein
MVNILIIDDNDSKISKITSVLLEHTAICSDDIKVSKYITSAKRNLRETQFDLVILDIQLPVHEDEAPLEASGLDLLNEIHDRTIYKKPNCILGLSAYEDKVEKAKPLFQDRLWSIILFDQFSEEWSDRLDRKVEYIIESRKNILTSDGPYNYDLAIITALPSPEFSQVLKLTKWEECKIESDITHYSVGKFQFGQKNLKVVAACAPQMGMPATAVLATKIISHFNPKYLCMVGITAGVPGEVKLGDILVADPSWDWGSGKLKQSPDGIVLLPDPLPERLDPSTRAMLRDVEADTSLILDLWDNWEGSKPEVPPELHIGPCVSGSSVVSTKEVVSDIQAHSRKLIGLEMEAYGLMHAASHASKNKPYTFSLKSVCDYADENKSDDIQKFCAYISANLLKRIALKYF